jgi:8-oxo-dGTP diphosphatase
MCKEYAYTHAEARENRINIHNTMPSNNFTVSVDMVSFAIRSSMPKNELVVFAYRRGARGTDPFPNGLSLPGAVVGAAEEFEQACARRLHEAFGMAPTHIEQLYTFGQPGRDPRSRTVAVSYLMLVPPRRLGEVKTAPEFGSGAAWLSCAEALQQKDWAFDHRKMVETGLRRLRAKVRYEPVIFSLLDTEFSTQDVWRALEAVCGKPFDRRNIAKRLKGFPFLVHVKTTPHPVTTIATDYYRFDAEIYAKWIDNGNAFTLWT